MNKILRKSILAITIALTSALAFSDEPVQEIELCAKYTPSNINARGYVIVENMDGTQNDLEIFESDGCGVYVNEHGWDAFKIKYVIYGRQPACETKHGTLTYRGNDCVNKYKKMLFTAMTKNQGEFDYGDLYISDAKSMQWDVSHDLEAVPFKKDAALNNFPFDIDNPSKPFAVLFYVESYNSPL